MHKKKSHIFMSVFNFCFSVSKILGWFKNQRTAVGKLMKNGKSGQGAEVLSRRKKWQLSSFAFLRQHIVPRTYTRDTGVSVGYFLFVYMFHTYPST